MHSRNVESMEITDQEMDSPEVGDADMVGRAEIKLVTFMAEHNIPFNSADHLTDLLRDMFLDSPTAQRMQLKRSNAGYVMKEIAKVSHNSLINDLKANKFSIIVNETTDISTSKTCAIVCKYFDKGNDCMSM